MMISGAWAAADQALMSGTSFLTVLLVARAVAPSQLGIFVLAYTGLWFFQNIQRALIVEPMNVLGANKEGDEFRAYVTSTAATQVAFAVMAAGAVLASGSLVPPARNLLSAFAIALVFWQLQEFVRRIFYTRTRVGAALLNDCVSYGGQAVLVVVLYTQGVLTPVSAMVAIAITNAVAVALGGWGVRADISTDFSVHSIWQAAASNWRFGRWLAGGELFREGVQRSYTFLLIAFVGPAGVGAFAAASIPARVNNLLFQSLNTLLPPLASRRLRRKSREEMEVFLKWVTLVAVVPAILGFSLVVVFAKEALHLVYGGSYDEFATVLRLVCLANFLVFLSLPLQVALRATENTKVLFLAGGVSGVFVITGGSLLAAVAGVTGAAIVMAVSAAIGLLVMTAGYWSVTPRRSEGASVAEGVRLEASVESRTHQRGF